MTEEKHDFAHKEHKTEVLHEHKADVTARRLLKPSPIWTVSTFVLLAVVIALLVSGGLPGTSLGSAALAKQTEDYLNKNVLTTGTQAVVSEATQVSTGLYKVKLAIGTQQFDSYVTADGKYIFPTAIDTTGSAEAPAQEKPAAVMPKSDKPKMDMYVMSQCPYGVQAENGMLEVVKALGDKMEYNIYYIANEGPALSFQSLHGQNEVDENIRQLCVLSKSKDKFFTYLECVNKDYRNAGTIWEKCATDAGVDVTAVKACASSDEGKKLLSENGKKANEKGVGGSPTIEINGASYSGARSSDAFKNAICGAFNTAPAECGKALTASTTAVQGGCVA